ncbi:NAD(P)H-quinone dehydrogenase [Actinotalea sp. M2MS4P-6]|uniref:NAD(P)H-quinone dehydrogenase n=1 Tax=Actinotalea sp. M2MS4P-6 TaxID=2983762 RepID=UPI0021E4CB8F|nr:NAD(P)H-quinone dehydrogenase [Actinotalea sp. M2MS4P-6]MCV2393508.1 NAD(P)H-quinone dehydrogenase [Actinotalea sp. M2MS4P-6]
MTAPTPEAAATPSPSGDARPPQRVVVLGGGPGGYEAALAARRAGADVTLIERRGVGGSAVLTDVVPSKTLIATAEWMTIAERAGELGIHVGDGTSAQQGLRVDLARVNERVVELARAQSTDIADRLERDGVRVVEGTGRLDGADRVLVDGGPVFEADAIVVAVGASPRVLPEAKPDGERVFLWTQLYRLTALPERMIVVGSGVTGAEFAGAYNALGADVVLVSSREHVLPGEDADAAAVLEKVFRSRGMTVLNKSRAVAARNVGDGVEVTLEDGRVVEGSHVLMAVGSIPNTDGIGLAEAGVRLTRSGHVEVDRVSRTNVRGIYAAGDCTGVLPLASVAAVQGRIAIAHALGDAVQPFDRSVIAANIFTAPEIATVGLSERELQEGGHRYVVSHMPLNRNPRAKMLGISDGFVKVFAREATGIVVGGVVVAPRAGELVFPLSLAVTQRLTADQVAQALSVYPSLSGTLSETARLAHSQRSWGA